MASSPKRKGGPLSRPPAKRTASSKAGPALALRHRSDIKAVYEALTGLYAVETAPASALDGHFQRVLDGATGGPCAQRLAARLIPRFLPRFPHHADAALGVLMFLGECRRLSSSTDENDEIKGTVTGTRCDALHGFRVIFELASKAGSAGEAAITKASNFLLRRVQQRESSRPSSKSADGASRAQDMAAEAAAAQAALEEGFCMCPQGVLTSCLEALSGHDATMRDGSRFFMQQRLLAVRDARREAGVTRGAAALLTSVLGGRPQLQDWLHAAAKTALADKEVIRKKESVKALTQLQGALASAGRQLPPLPLPPHMAQAQLQPHMAKEQPLPQPVPPPAIALAGVPPPLAAPSAALPAPPPPPNRVQIQGDPSAPVTSAAAARLVPSGAAASLAVGNGSPVLGGSAKNGLRLHPVHQPGGRPRTESPEEDGQLPLPSPRRATPLSVPAAAPAMPFMPSNVMPIPGGRLCEAIPCIWIACLPPMVGEMKIRRECSRFGVLQSVRFPPCQRRDQALVAFVTLEHTALCYEALCGATPWPGGPPLEVEICTDGPPGGRQGGRWSTERAAPGRTPAHMWVAGVRDAAAQAHLLDALLKARLPKPAAIMRVGGLRPGVMLEFTSSTVVDTAMEALRQALPPSLPPHMHTGQRAPLRGGPGSPRHVLTFEEREALRQGTAAGAQQPEAVPRPSPANADRSPADVASATAAAALAPMLPPPPVLVGGRPRWSGTLCKSGAPHCEVVCRDCSTDNKPAASIASAVEPDNWPPSLDMCARAVTATLLEHVMRDFSPEQRAVQRLTALPGDQNRRGFQDFVKYLEDKQRAGVVELPPGSVQSVATGANRRAYLIPPSKTTCHTFGVEWDPQEMLLILVVPAADH